MPPRLRGRAEAVRAVLRDSMEPSAPVLFGLLAGQVFHGPDALRATFVVKLAPLAAAALLTLAVGRRTYPRLVATALASTRALARRRPCRRAAQRAGESA